MKIKQRTILAPPMESDLASADGGEGLAFWKQVLPMGKIHYTTKSGKRSTLNFDKQYLTDLATAFDSKVLDQTPFVLADKDNAHTMQPEHFRGEIAEVRLANEGEKPGLYAKIKFASKEAAKAVLDNPGLGVSARIREGLERSDGSFVKRAMIHVLGTLDPQVTGMTPWVPAVADLSFDPSDNILDLSDETYEGAPVAKKTEAGVPDIEAVTDEQIDAMTEEELDAFLTEYAPGILAEIEAEGTEPDPIVPAVEPVKELEPALSATQTKDIELANATAVAANARAEAAMRKMADAEFKAYRSEAIAAGVPPHVLDLAEPVLNRPEDMIVDLSTSGEEDVNAGDIVRQLVEGYKGTVDLSTESGHYGSIGSDEDPDKDDLIAWGKQF